MSNVAKYSENILSLENNNMDYADLEVYNILNDIKSIDVGTQCSKNKLDNTLII